MAKLFTTPTLVGACLSVMVAATTTATAHAQIDYEFHQRLNGLVAVDRTAPVEPVVPVEPVEPDDTSCKQILDTGNSVGNGLYTVGVGSQTLKVYCDMTTDGGGWTLIAAQFELDPVRSWGEGIQADYDPTLSNMRGFTLDSSEIPLHSQVAAGKNLMPTFVDYWNYTYTTGNIPRTVIEGLKSGLKYHIHRNIGGYYGNHDPEGNTGSYVGDWGNTLTFDRLNGIGNDWAFSPLHAEYPRRGYALKGAKLHDIKNSEAWTVWVR